MYISIDMDNLQFLHKHRLHEVVSALAYLEACDRSTLVDSTDREHFLMKLTPLELRMLYRNTTGLDITGTGEIVVREMLATVVDRLKDKLALLEEVEHQIAAVYDDLEKGIPWTYAFGSKKPSKQEQLFPLHCQPLDPVSAQAAATRAPQQRAQRAAPKAPAPAAPAPQPPQPAKTRGFNVRPIIWALADEMWEAAGKPTDKAVVLQLRKQMMDALEKDRGVKRTSSSNELGNWMKERLA